MRRSLLTPRWPARAVLGAACVAAVAGPPAAHADSLLFAKGDQIWIAHSDGSAARQVTTGHNNWAWPSMSDDGTLWAAGGLPRINADGSDSDGSDSVYHFDQAGREIDPPVGTYGSHSTPACPTYSPWNLRVSPDGLRVSYNAFFCDNMDSFYAGAATGPSTTTLISENYEVSNWIDTGHILITHEGDTFGNAAFAEYDIADPASSHGPGDDPYLPDYEAASSRSGNRVAVYEDDPLFDGSGVDQADIRVYTTTDGDVTQVSEKCTIALNASNAVTTVDAAPTFSPDGTRLAWGAKDGIHHATTSNLDNCSTVRDDGLLVPGGAQPFFGPADEQPAPPSNSGGPTPPTPPSGTPIPPPSGGSTTPGDTTPTASSLTIHSSTHRARLSKHRTITVKLRATRTGHARVSGYIKLGHRKLRFHRRTVTLHGGHTASVALKLSKTAARRVRSALSRHAKVTARITVAMTAAGAGSRTVHVTVRVRR